MTLTPGRRTVTVEPVKVPKPQRTPAPEKAPAEPAPREPEKVPSR